LDSLAHLAGFEVSQHLPDRTDRSRTALDERDLGSRERVESPSQWVRGGRPAIRMGSLPSAKEPPGVLLLPQRRLDHLLSQPSHV